MSGAGGRARKWVVFLESISPDRHQWSKIARIEIGSDRGRAAFGVSQGDVAVGSQEINGIALQAGPAHLRTPGKNVQLQFSVGAHDLNCGSGVAINVNLPVH